MSGHAAYLAGAFGMACLAIVLELALLARRRRRALPDDPQ
ncbi:heme exporter protein CcmD [Cupriavidus agavae]|uniref:Heme exporter protein D n=1 Tax=Cupriavidus agavae TaxID=1001822 RepID=A0A4Q7RRM1_9BURK|nr:heme exporter protein CcmD [Cupriavidus agavae]RZT36355.1 heme exporter protein CcmD [Cupriavidus agavae]